LLEENFSQHKFEFPSPYEEEVERTLTRMIFDGKKWSNKYYKITDTINHVDFDASPWGGFLKELLGVKRKKKEKEGKVQKKYPENT
jgi:hypothetical protein